jgi:hypothetical protein
MSSDPAKLTHQPIQTAEESAHASKIGLPLDVLAAISEIEAQVKKCLNGCRETGNALVDGCLLDIGKVEEIMLAAAAALFRVLAEFQESQRGSGTEGYAQSIEEASKRTLSLVPFSFCWSSRYGESKKGIARAIGVELQHMANRPSQSAIGAGAVVPKRKRGRTSKIPIQAKKDALAAKGKGAKGKKIAQILYGILYPSRGQVKNSYAILKHFEAAASNNPDFFGT